MDVKSWAGKATRLPFVAWHGGRQNSTGHATSFWAFAHTGRFVVVWQLSALCHLRFLFAIGLGIE
jgi:hypothetical protein